MMKSGVYRVCMIKRNLSISVFVPRRWSKGTIKMGSSLRPRFHPSVDTMRLVACTRNFSYSFNRHFETLQVFLTWSKNVHVVLGLSFSYFYLFYYLLSFFSHFST